MVFLLNQRALSSRLLTPLRQSLFLRQQVANSINKNGIKSTNAASLRFMGGGGAEPPEPQSMKAELFGNDLEAHDKGWKLITQVTYAVALFITGLIAFAPDTSIQSWAQGEARARLKARDAGVKLEFGKHYNTEDNYDFAMKSPIDDPFNQEDDDDDEDEDDEEEEEEDDEDDE